MQFSTTKQHNSLHITRPHSDSIILLHGGSSKLQHKRKSNGWLCTPKMEKVKLPLPVSRTDTASLVRIIQCTDREATQRTRLHCPGKSPSVERISPENTASKYINFWTPLSLPNCASQGSPKFPQEGRQLTYYAYSLNLPANLFS